MTRQSAKLAKGPYRRRTPSILQMEEAECGAASLAMILSYWGLDVTLEQLRIACGVSRDGSNAGSIVKVARSYHLGAHGKRISIDHLPSAETPFIAYWNERHFLVVEGRRGDTWYLNDPASGRRELSTAEFARSYSDIALFFHPDENFVKHRTSRSSFLRTLARPLRHSQAGLWFALIAGVFLVLPGVIIPGFTQVFVDEILEAGITNWLFPLVAGIALILVLEVLLRSLQRWVLLRLRTTLNLSMSGGYFWHLLRLPVEFFAQRSAGGLVDRVQINGKIASLLSGQLASALIGVVAMAFFLVVMIDRSWQLSIIAVVAAGLNFAALKWASQARVTENQRLVRERVRLSGLAYGGLASIESIQAQGAESEFLSRYYGVEANTITYNQRLGRLTALVSLTPTLLLRVSNLLILVCGSYLVIQDSLTLGGLVAFQTIARSFLRPSGTLVGLGDAVQNAHAELQQINDVLDYPAEVGLRGMAPAAERADATTAGPEDEIADPKEFTPLRGELTISDLSFGYNPTKPPLIADLDLDVPVGGRVAIVGQTGSGKSTIGNLVAGLQKPWQGEILFDGQPRRELPRAVLTAGIAKVDQDIFLFAGTVAENLRLWDDTITDEQLWRALADAAIIREINGREGGLQTKVAEGGLNFSGGQRQRLEIAKALARDPAVLILDEATSALDADTEMQIDTALRRRGCTCLIIAHRLSTIRDCDEIIVLDHGKVVQRGTHDVLIAQKGKYAELIRDD